MKLSDLDQAPAGPLRLSQIVNAPTLSTLEDAFWTAKLRGDEAGAGEAFRALRAQGGTIGKPPQELIDRDRQRVADEQSFGQNLAAGVGATLTTFPRRLDQLIDTATGGFIPGSIPSLGLEASKADEAAQREVDAPLRSTVGGMIGGVGAEAAPLVAGGVLARSTPMVEAFLPTTVRGAATQGAAIGASQPLATGEGTFDRINNAVLGGVAGTAGAGVPRVLGGAARVVQRITDPFSEAGQERAVARFLHNAADDPATLTQQQPSNNPGVNRTLAEQTLDPGIANVQRQFPIELTAQQDANNLALVRVIEGTFEGASKQSGQAIRDAANRAQTPALKEIKAATGAPTLRVVKALDRMANAPDFRNFPETQQFLSTARQMMTKPLSTQDRLKSAEAVLNAAVTQPQRRSTAAFNAMLGARKLVRSALQNGDDPAVVAQALKKTAGLTVADQADLANAVKLLRTTEAGKDDVASLYNARQFITQELMPSLSGKSMRAARSFLRTLDNSITEAAPGFKKYLKDISGEFRRADQADIGAALLNRGAVSGTNAVTRVRTLTPAKFQGVTNDLDQLVQKTTGFERNRAAKALTPQQQAVIANIRDDMARLDRANNAGRAVGSNTRQNLIAADVAAFPGDLGGLSAKDAPIKSVQSFSSLGDKAYALFGVPQRLNPVLLEVLKNPGSPKAQAVLSRLPRADRKLLDQSIGRFTGTSLNVIFPPAREALNE